MVPFPAARRPTGQAKNARARSTTKSGRSSAMKWWARDQLSVEVVGHPVRHVHHAGPDTRFLGTEVRPRRDGEVVPPVGAPSEARDLGEDEVAVQPGPGASPGGISQPCREYLDLVVGERIWRCREVAEEMRRQRTTSQQQRSEPRCGDDRLEPQVRHTDKQVGVEADVGMRPQADQLLDPLRMVEGELERDQRPEVVCHHPHPGQAQGVEEGEDVCDEARAVVAVGGRLGPAGAAQIWRDDAVALGKGADDVAPLPPVLREAVQQQHRVTLPGLGDG
jgi:hypothetical protein